MKAICVLPGDGIGPEVVACATRVLEAVSEEFEFVHAEIGREAFRKTGSFLPTDTLELMADSDSCLFGAVTSVSEEHYDSPVLRFRKELHLDANIRPVRDIAKLSSKGVDLVIVRENSEGLYTMDEHQDEEGVTTLRRVTRVASRRIVEHAIKVAESRERGRICCVHKANVLRKSDGLFLKTFKELMDERAGNLIQEDQLVDSAAARLVTAPHEFDVIVTLNLYGDILSDVAAGVVGGLGFAPSGNIGPEHSVFEPAHGSAPDIAGKGTANPTAAILAAGMMLGHLGMSEEEERVYRAVCSTYGDGKRTIDIGGNCGSGSFTAEVLDRL
jgi:isopropylmalate/isohomocitrate dehydrogenase-like protein